MRTRRGAPLWLVGPSRFAGMSRSQARLGLALFAMLLLACLTATSAPGPRPNEARSTSAPLGQTELLLYQSVVANVRSGTPYYVAAAEAHRVAHAPLKPYTTVRLPTLAVVQAAVPPLLVTALLPLLCIGAMGAWIVRLRPAMTGPIPVGIAGLLILTGLYVHLEPPLVVFPEVWAGALIALSLALRRPGEWIPAVALGLSAMLIRETALIYVVIMAVIAWIEGERREAAAWVGATLVFFVALAAHAHAVTLVTGPLDRSAQGLSGLEGFGFYVQLVTLSSGLALLPDWLAAVLIATALFGWLAWRDPAAVRALATLLGYAAVIALGVRSDDFPWALITTPVLLVGIVFAVDGLRDMIVAARDTRRITVTRVIG